MFDILKLPRAFFHRDEDPIRYLSLLNRVRPQEKQDDQGNLPYLNSLNLSYPAFGSRAFFQQAPVVRFFFGKKCILYCSHCFTNAPCASKNAMEESDVNGSVPCTTETIRQFRDYFGLKTVLINGKGEPMLKRAELVELIKNTHKMGLKTALFTSGLLLTKSDIHFFQDHSTDLVLKLPSLSPARTSEVTGFPVQKKLERSISNCIDAGLTRDNRLGIDHPFMRLSGEGLTDTAPESIYNTLHVFDFCRRNKIIPLIEPLILAGRADIYRCPREKDVTELARRMSLQDTVYGYHWSPTRRKTWVACDPRFLNNFFQVGLLGTIHFIRNGHDYHLNDMRRYKKPLPNVKQLIQNFAQHTRA